jgi:hypothetical protein
MAESIPHEESMPRNRLPVATKSCFSSDQNLKMSKKAELFTPVAEFSVRLAGKVCQEFATISLYIPLYHRERILKTSTLSCSEEEEEITKPPTR